MRVLITGITGQDGSYLAEKELLEGNEVHGIFRRASVFNTERIDHLLQGEPDDHKITLHYGDVMDFASIFQIIMEVKPHIIYNLAAQSNVGTSYKQPIYTMNITGMGAINVFEAVRQAREMLGMEIYIYQASSSEMFGNAPAPQSISTKMNPISPYAVAKHLAYEYSHMYNETYGMKICNGILFNHESPRRGERFVTRKITKAVNKILKGEQKELHLGNIDAKRDWGHAKDYVRAMMLMMNRMTITGNPIDYVVATGRTYTVREFLEIAFSYVGLDYMNYVFISEKYKRPNDIEVLLGDPQPIMNGLNWKPSYSFKNLVEEMVENDIGE